MFSWPALWLDAGCSVPLLQLLSPGSGQHPPLGAGPPLSLGRSQNAPRPCWLPLTLSTSRKGPLLNAQLQS